MLDDQRTLARKDLEPEATDKEHLVVRHLPYISCVGNDVIMLRDGDVVGAFVVEGFPAATAREIDVFDLSDAMSASISQLGTDVAVYVQRISAGVRPSLAPVDRSAGLFASSIDEAWQSAVRAGGLRSRQTVVTVAIRPSKVANLWAQLVSGGKGDMKAQRLRRVDRLNEIIANLMNALRAARPERLTLSGGDWLGLIRSTLTGTFFPTAPGSVFTPLADLIATSRLDFVSDTFMVHGLDSEETRFGAVFSLKQYPAETEPGVFDKLDLPYDMVITQSFLPIDNVAAEERISRTIRQMRSTEDAAVSLRDQLNDAKDDLASRRISFGAHHATVVVFAQSEEELDDASARIRSAVQTSGGVMVREDIGARTAFFAQHPGNFAYRARTAMISSLNFAQMAALHGAPLGLPADRTPWGEAVTILPTITGEPYRFNFHQGGDFGERTVGHSLVVGRTGAGKTLGVAFLLAQAQRLAPRVIIFDKDQGFEMAVRALGGDYSNVRMGMPTGFNPFRAEADERGTAWLTDWVMALMRQQGDLTPEQREAINNATRSNLHTDAALQNLHAFRTQLRSAPDREDLYTRLGLWDRDGQYGWLFAGEEGDEALSFFNDVTAFDLTEVLDNPEVRTAWLAYVFRRIERAVEDERPTLVVLDEAWKLLDDPYFQAKLKDWMLTMRKKNAVVVLLTQRVEHITDSAAGGSILESATTTMLYPSRDYTLEGLAPLNLTDAEVAFATSSGAGNRFVLIRSDGESAICDLDLSSIGPLLRVLGGGKGEEAPSGWRDDANFWRDI